VPGVLPGHRALVRDSKNRANTAEVVRPVVQP
jgi:hypothetical protein